MFSNLSKIALALSFVLIIVLLLSANSPSQPINKPYVSQGEDQPSENDMDNTEEDNTEHQFNENLKSPSEPASEEKDKSQEEEPKVEYVLYEGTVENIFFQPLIAYPERAFDNDNRSSHMEKWYITVNEFERILNSLYENDYILVNMDKAYKVREENGRKVFESRSFLLPKGKKPLVITVDDLNYYDYMKSNGMVHKLILDDSGNIAEYTQFDGQSPIISYDKSIISILESFIQDHKDFSFEGARGIIALTGYNGILGYDTSNSNSPHYENDVEKATEIVEKLKDIGWVFASHGYSHLDANNISYDSFALDCQRWDTYVRPIVGPTSIYVYPYGSTVRTSDDKYDVLLDYGFDVFMGVGTQTPIYFRRNSIHTDRVPIDGRCVKGNYGDMSRFFDIEEVIDNNRPGVK